MTANVAGAAVVFVLLGWVLPLPDVPDDLDARRTNGIVAGAFVAACVPVGFAWSYRRVRHVVRWLRSDRPPKPGEQTRTLRAPVRLLVVEAALWTAGAALFSRSTCSTRPGWRSTSRSRSCSAARSRARSATCSPSGYCGR